MAGRRRRQAESRCFLVAPEQWQEPILKLSPTETHHLARVLRLPVGSVVEVTDGQGRRGRAEIVSLTPSEASLRLVAEIPEVTESPLAVTLAQALCRADSFDLIVRQATELGLQRLLPFFAARSLIRPESWRPARMQRWQRLAREALKSSERRQLPLIEAPVDLATVLSQPEPVKIMFWEEKRRMLEGGGAPLPEKQGGVLLIIGPEGGFTPAEVEAAQEAGCRILGLGPRRLRVETAAVAALAIIQHKWGDMVW